jgi:hypothetical protein
MLRSLGLFTILTSLLGLAGCGDPNAGALFADVQYATRCDDTLGCGGSADRDVCGFNRSDPCIEDAPEATLSCTVTESETSRTISFSARQGPASISVESLTVPLVGGSASGGACRVRVVEGANTYTGGCGGSEPNEAQPCRISNVSFYDDEGNPTFEGDLFCQFLQNQSNPTLAIEVTAKGNGPGPASSPGTFRFANCTGLSL